MTIAPGKTTPLPWRPHDMEDHTIVGDKPGREVCNFLNGFGDRDAHMELVLTAVNALHAIAPGKEFELAEALPDAFVLLQNLILLGEDDVEDMADLHSRVRALLTKLILNEERKDG